MLGLSFYGQDERVLCHPDVIVTGLLPRGRVFGSACKIYDDVSTHFKLPASYLPELYQPRKDERIIVSECGRVNELLLISRHFHCDRKAFQNKPLRINQQFHMQISLCVDQCLSAQGMCGLFDETHM